MPKSPAERKAAQRARQSAAGERKIELVLDEQEVEMLARNCAARRPGRDPYEMAEYIALLIRQMMPGCAAGLTPSANGAAASAEINCQWHHARTQGSRMLGYVRLARNKTTAVTCHDRLTKSSHDYTV